MAKKDISQLQPIGYYRDFFGIDMNIYSFERKNDDTVYALWAEYTGAGYKAHYSKVYNLTENPYIVHSWHCAKYRKHIEDFYEVTSINNGYMMLEGNGLNLWDYLK